MNTNNGTMGLREYARHRDVSPSYVHKCLTLGILQRNESGRIDVARADAILDERRSFAQPLVLAANAARRRHRAAAGADADDSLMIDPVEADESLRWQPVAFVQRESAETPEARIFAAWERRLVIAQSEIISAALQDLRRAGGIASNSEAFRMALGKLWGRLRALVDSERDVLEREVAERLAAPHGLE